MRKSAKKQQSQVQTIQRTVTRQRYKYTQILERQSLVFPSMLEDLLLFLTTGIKKTAVWKTTFVSEHQGRENIGRAGEAVKRWGQWKLTKNKKIVTIYACYCSPKML